MKQYDCVIIGGGASGVMAALSVRKHYPLKKILLIEKESQLLRKVQASGNGRCNLSNLQIKPDNYYSLSSGKSTKVKFLKTIFNIFSFRELKKFFLNLGIPLRIDAQGRVYPHSEQASSVVETLTAAINQAEIDVLLETYVEKIEQDENLIQILLKSSQGQAEKMFCNKLILACGSNAAKNLGGSGLGYSLLSEFAEFSELRPALVPLDLHQEKSMRKLAGERFKGIATLYKNNQKLITTEGEFLFTKTGLSGIAGMELARFIESKQNSNVDYSVEIDFAPDYTSEELQMILNERQQELTKNNLEQLSIGLVKHNIAVYLAEQATSIKDLSESLKTSKFKVTGTKGFEFAQVTAGGVNLAQVFSPALNLKSCPNIYICGELLDIDGKTGGFNLQWAWSSGYIAGQLR